MITIHFQILPPISHSAEPMRICGNLAELGEWDTEQALRLEYRAPFHVGQVEVPEGTHLEYKIVRDAWETEAVDAYGDVPVNLLHEAWFDITLHHVVADWKDRFSGRVSTEKIESKRLAGSRDLLVWIPPSYHSDNARFPVLVMHDGDNVFDPTTSVISGVDWAADEWVASMSSSGRLPEILIVAVRHPEGFAEDGVSMRDFDLSPQLGGEAYAAFIAEELIPHIDTHYRTKAEPESRILAGADLGGLISLHTALRYPGVFGSIACLSTAFEDVSETPPQYAQSLRVLEEVPALPERLRAYFDYGTEARDECYEGYHRMLGEILRSKGWRDGETFDIRRIPGGSHDELSWRQRFGAALEFLVHAAA